MRLHCWATVGRPHFASRGYRLVRFSDVRRFSSALGRPDRRTVCHAVLDGAHVVSTLKRSGLRPLLLERRDLPTADPVLAKRAADAVDAGLGVLPVKATCLRRSVTLLRELNRQRLGATLVIGVRRGRTGMEAHAWVQAGDEIVNDDVAVTGTYLPISVGDVERISVSWI